MNRSLDFRRCRITNGVGAAEPRDIGAGGSAGQPPREEFVIQLEEAPAEWKRHKGTMMKRFEQALLTVPQQCHDRL
jgi:hypothetical protein